MRVILLCLVVLGGLSQLAPAASISAVLNLNDGATNPGVATFGSNVQHFGTIVDAGSGVGIPPANVGVVVLIPEASVTIDGPKTAHVKTDARRTDPISTQNVEIYLTTYAYFTGVTTTGQYRVTNSAYWEFQVNGNYNWSISAQAPQFSGARRTFSFEKVGESVLAFDNVGSQAQNASGALGSGTYRLFYAHTNGDHVGDLLDPGPNPNGSTNLDIFFTFQSEDSSGVVPEPTSVAVFGLLGIGGAVAKWRRKK
jgi:hypothetical protein